jgi:hypothetical protein
MFEGEMEIRVLYPMIDTRLNFFIPCLQECGTKNAGAITKRSRHYRSEEGMIENILSDFWSSFGV